MKAIALAAAAALAAADDTHYVPGVYNYSCTGHCDAPVAPQTTPGALLGGGGTDCDDAMAWLMNKGGLGDIVILRATGTDAYNEYLMDMSAPNSVTTLVLESRAASSNEFVLERVNEADAVFFAGGDQWTYVDQFTNTPLQAAVRRVARRAPVGGTSAGCALEGGFVYTAEHDSVYSDEALANPYDRHITLGASFFGLDFLPMVTDTHFVTRDRMGRLAAFVARSQADGWVADGAPAFGLGVDEHSALLMEADGTGTMAGAGSAYACRATAPPATCERDTPLSAELDCFKLNSTEADTIDFNAWKSSGLAYDLSIVDGEFETSPYGS